jgi:hypothetical protein
MCVDARDTGTNDTNAITALQETRVIGKELGETVATTHVSGGTFPAGLRFDKRHIHPLACPQLEEARHVGARQPALADHDEPLALDGRGNDLGDLGWLRVCHLANRRNGWFASSGRESTFNHGIPPDRVLLVCSQNIRADNHVVTARQAGTSNKQPPT